MIYSAIFQVRYQTKNAENFSAFFELLTFETVKIAMIVVGWLLVVD